MGNSKALENFCFNVHHLRIYHNLTQKQMADIIGISVGTLRKLEASSLQVRINCNMLYRICEHFQISADVILFEALDLTHS